jgi:hypothetical protein
MTGVGNIHNNELGKVVLLECWEYALMKRFIICNDIANIYTMIALISI